MEMLTTGAKAVIMGAQDAHCRLVSIAPSASARELAEAARSCAAHMAAETELDALSAVECSIGASLAGGRALAVLDSAELIIASDAIKAAASTGVGAGLVIVLTDGGAKAENTDLALPVIALSTASDCYGGAARAFELSEERDAPALLLLDANVESDTVSIEPVEYAESPLPPYRKRAEKFVPALSGREALCPGCPHLGTLYCLSKLWLTVIGDVGCLQLGANAPMHAVDACFNAASSVAALRGFTLTRGEGSLRSSAALCDGEAFRKRAASGLMTALKRDSGLTVLLTDTADGAGDKSLEALCGELGIASVRSIDPLDTAALEKALREELASKETGVIIARRPCALISERGARVRVNTDRCVGCKSCVKPGCPAISFERNRASIDPALCFGCGLCQKLCRTGAILPLKESAT